MKRFTLIELLVCLSILGILGSFILPVLTEAKDKTRASICVNNLNNIARANVMYSDDSDGFFVPTLIGAKSWSSNDLFRQMIRWDENLSDGFMAQSSACNQVLREVKSSSDNTIYKSSEKSVNSNYSYAPVYTANNNSLGFEGVKLDWIKSPASLAHMGEVENDPEMMNGGDLSKFAVRHLDKTNMSFFDGHVEFFTSERLQQAWNTNQMPFADSDGSKLTDIVDNN